MRVNADENVARKLAYGIHRLPSAESAILNQTHANNARSFFYALVSKQDQTPASRLCLP
jgi:hypothetical protein